jgi:hypothetical protein
MRVLKWAGIALVALVLVGVGASLGSSGDQSKGDAAKSTAVAAASPTADKKVEKATKDAATDSDGDGVLDIYDEDDTAPKATPTPKPRAPRVGDSIDLSGSDSEIKVKVVRVIDPLSGGEFDTPDNGKRYVGIEIQMTNMGDSVYSDSPSNGAVLLYGDDRQAESTIIAGGPCAGGFSTSVKLRPGARRRGCIPFEMSTTRKPKGFQFALDSGFSDDLGEWKLR